MSVAPPVSLDKAEAFLAGRFGPHVSGTALVGEGHWSRCYGFVLDGRDLVVRFGNHVEDFERDRFAVRFASPSLPVPEMVDLIDLAPHPIGSARWAAVSTRVFGQPLEMLDHDGWRRTLPAVLDLLDATRALDCSATTGYGPWDGVGRGRYRSWHESLRSIAKEAPDARTPGWRAAIARSPAAEPVFTAGVARLTRLADAAPTERHLIHDDLLNRNVLVADGRITGVFDWGCSAYGDHLYDLAHLAFWAPWYPALDALDITAVARAHLTSIDVPAPDFDARILLCQLRLGLANLGYAASLGDPSAAWITDRLSSLLDP